MDTLIIVTFAVLLLLAMIGFAYMCATLAGLSFTSSAVRWATGTLAPHESDPVISPKELEEVDQLIRESRKAAGLAPIDRPSHS